MTRRFLLLATIGFAWHPLTPAQEVEAIEPNRGGDVSYEARDPEFARNRLVIADGYQVELFATEKDFPIGNPVALTFDAKGRLWVATMPSYPQRLPDSDPDDKLVILEDIDRDGKADRHIVFADGLHLPAGFELGDGGAYIAQQPNLIFAKDTSGDDMADEREVILHGFGTEDSHHAISAFTWGPGGALYFQEGTFHHSQVETPYGPVRLVNAGVFRYKPQRFWLEVFVSYPFANPWGHVFDRWGQNFIADASGGANYFGTAITGNAPYPEKRSSMKVFTSVVRPTAGCEFVSSRHFPPEAQGNFLINNNIGFQGIKQHRVFEEGSGFASEEVEPLLYSRDINFRPVDLQFGPDGALYVVDWFNPLIGHMQYSLRHPERDHGHGRIWRITHTERPLVKPARIDGASIPALLDLLKTYEDRTRYRTRIELRNRDRDEVAAAVETWIEGLDNSDADYEHRLLEALWVYQTVNVFKPDHLERMLNSSEPRARAAATRVLRFWRGNVDDPVSMFRERIHDGFPRVRLEALLGLSYIMTIDSTLAALDALDHPRDYYLDYVLNETVNTLGRVWKPELRDGSLRIDDPDKLAYLLDRVSTGDLKRFTKSTAVNRVLAARPGISTSERIATLQDVARAEGTSLESELFRAIDATGQRDGDDTVRAIAGLTAALQELDPGTLRGEQAQLSTLAESANHEVTRRGAYAALIASGRSADDIWDAASQHDRLDDLFGALPLVEDDAARLAFYTYAADVASGSIKAGADARRAAVRALPAFDTREHENAEVLAALVENGQMRETAIQTLRRVPTETWPPDALGSLQTGVVQYIDSLPLDRLSSREARTAFELGEQVAALLPEIQATAYRARLANLGITAIKLRPVPHQVAFDRTEFAVPAGKPVEIDFDNIDIMPHNVVITEPGEMEAVGRAAEAMSTEPDAEIRDYVPDMDAVLFKTRLLYPGSRERLTFVAPSTPGDYPFVCTYPSHWITMNGIMRVVPELSEAMLAANREEPLVQSTAHATDRTFVKFWQVDELLPGLAQAQSGRSFATGAAMFDVTGCVKCHTMRGVGAAIGPDLTSIHDTYTADELLLHIIEPSEKVDDEYVTYMVETDSNMYAGLLADQDDKTVQIRANALKPEEITTISRADITAMDPMDISPMPQDLLITLRKTEIYDLIAYLMSGADPQHPAFQSKQATGGGSRP